MTWLLKDCLGGNSKTTIIAALSPADVNYDETLSTLRYADQAKRIKNKAIVNEDPNAKLIRELKEELLDLRSKLGVYDPIQGPNVTAPDTLVTIVDLHGNSRTLTKEQLQDEVQASEKIMAELNETWEEKLRKTQEIQQEREKTLEELGISVEKGHIGVHTPKKMPHLVNLNEDPLMSECLVYQLKPGKTQVGKLESSSPADIRLSGTNIGDAHCYFENNDSVVTVHPGTSSVTMVNGLRISKPKRLRSGFRIILGDYHIFRFNHPEEVRRERDLQGTPDTSNAYSPSAANTHPNRPNSMEDDTPEDRPDSPISSASVMSEFVDWNYARKEAVIHAHMLSESNINHLKDQDLDVLFENITKIRYLRRSRSVRSESRTGDDDTESRSSRMSILERWNSDHPLSEQDTRESPIPPLESSALALREKLRLAEEEVQHMSQQRQEYETKIQHLSAAEAKSDELQIEKAFMEEKLQQAHNELVMRLEEQREQFEEKMKRMSLTSLSNLQLQTKKKLQKPHFTERELELVQRTLTRWKEYRTVHMAEIILTNAVLVKEANIISRQLSKQVVYQFTIVEPGQFANPTSYWESNSGLSEFDSDEDTQFDTLKRPSVVIKVTDSKHHAVYMWSLEKLKVRLHRMRNLYNFADRPQYRQHFNMEDPFYESPSPRFTFIGSASVSLKSLVRMKFQDSVVPILCRTTGKAIGSCRIGLTPLNHNGATSSATATSPSATTSPKSRGTVLSRGFFDQDLDTIPVDSSETHGYGQEEEVVHIGDQLLFEISLLTIEGLSEQQYTQVHAQFRLSNLSGSYQSSSDGTNPSAQERVFATDPVSGFGKDPIFFGFTQTLSMMVMPPMLEVLTNGSLHFEVFGQAKTAALTAWEHWDMDQENLLQNSVGQISGPLSSRQQTRHPLHHQQYQDGSRSVRTKRTSRDHGHRKSRTISHAGSIQPGPVTLSPNGSLSERLSEDELMMEERHDVLAHVQVCELAPTGEYVAVQVLSNSTIDAGTFQLRQGLQRRIILSLSHASGRQFPWHRVSNIQIGKVRLLDRKSCISTEPSPIVMGDISLKIIPDQKVDYPTDGTSVLVVQASWDSTLHESLFLNRVTASNTRILLTLSWSVEAERCEEPMRFKMDIAAQIQDRKAKAISSSYRLTSFLITAPKIMSKVSGLFLLTLRPIVAKKASELWRMNTASKYVRGEEFLLGWKPRGVSLLQGFKARTELVQKREAVERTRQWLGLIANNTLDGSHGSRLQGLRAENERGSNRDSQISTATDSTAVGSESYSSEDSDMRKIEDQRIKALLRRCLALWLHKSVTLDEVTTTGDVERYNDKIL